MVDRVFCAIVAGDEPASVVFEDELTMAFLDIRQFHPGHVLVIPKGTWGMCGTSVASTATRNWAGR